MASPPGHRASGRALPSPRATGFPEPMPMSSRTSKQYDVLSGVVEDISGELALEPLLARIIERACTLVGADDGVIGLYEPARDVIRTAASYNIPPQELNAVLERGEGLTGRVLELDAPLRCRYGDLPRPTRDEALDMNMLGLPIHARGRLVGVLGVGSWPPRVLDAAAEQLLDLFARHAAIAIVNAQRYAEEQRRAARFALIARVAAIGAAPSRDLDALLQRVADAIHEMLDYPNVDIPLLDPGDPQTLVVRIRGGAYKRLIRGEDRLPVSSGIMGAAVVGRRPQWVNDVRADGRYVAPPGVPIPLAELAIPILHGNEVLGVLNVEGDHPFDDLDCMSLGIIAEHLGVAIANARMHDYSKRAALLEERHRLARDLHDNVTQLLSSMSLITQSLEAAWDRDPAEGVRRVNRLGELSALAFAELRGMLHELSPGALPRPRAGEAADEGLPQLLERVLPAMAPAPIRLRIRTDGYLAQLPAHEQAILRISQEAVSNAVRHASPRRIDVAVRLDAGKLRLRIRDDGSGMPERVTHGMGLRNMRARLRELHGTLRISSRPHGGTCVAAWLPRTDRNPE